MGDALLCDFGASDILQASSEFGRKKDGTIIGTGVYFAPELIQIDDEVVAHQTNATDVWAFGITIYVSTITLKYPLA